MTKKLSESLLSQEGVLKAMRTVETADQYNTLYQEVQAAHDFKNHDTTLRNGRRDADNMFRWASSVVAEEKAKKDK